MYLVTMRGHLTFTVVRSEPDGELRTVSGWFDTRSAEDGLTAEVVMVTDGAESDVPEPMQAAIIEATPGKGEVAV